VLIIDHEVVSRKFLNRGLADANLTEKNATTSKCSLKKISPVRLERSRTTERLVAGAMLRLRQDSNTKLCISFCHILGQMDEKDIQEKQMYWQIEAKSRN
jgi:hypothetical protein